MSEPPREIKLAPGEEFFIEVLGHEVSITLQSGCVEYYGCPLDLGIQYSFPMGALPLLKAPVETPYESIMQITGKFHMQGTPQRCVYSAEIRNLLEYLNVKRSNAMNLGTDGPVVLVCGKKNTGKSRMCRVLCNSAVAENFHVQLLDLSIENSSITLPRHIASVAVEDFFPPVGDIEPRLPFVSPFDHAAFPQPSQDTHWKLFENLLQNMFSHFTKKARESSKLRCGGIVIEVPPSMFLQTNADNRDEIHPALALAAQIFQVEHICLVENEEGDYSSLSVIRASNLQKTKHLHRLEFMYKSNISLGRALNRSNEKIYRYFCGAAFKLKCFQVAVDYSKFTFHAARNSESTDSSLYTINVEDTCHTYASRLASILDVKQDEDPSLSRVLGFVLIIRVDTSSKKIFLVTPSPNAIPTKHMFITQYSADVSELLHS